MKDENLEILSKISSGPVSTLRWKKALNLLEERNPSLIAARKRIKEIKRAKDEQWKTWLPSLSAFGNIQSSLSELGSLSLSDANLAVFAPLRIPNPLSERAIAFQNALTYLQAVDDLEVSYRQEVRNLYVLFSDEETARLTASISRAAEVNVDEGLSALKRREDESDRLKVIQGRMARILNLPGRNILPVGSSRPKLDYSRKIDRLVPGQNYGELAVRLYAFQIEAAILSAKGIKLQRLPSLSLSGSTPAIYDTRRNDRTGAFDADTINLFGSLGDSYDFTGSEARAVETAEENIALVRERLLRTMDQESREWLRLKSAYRKILIEKKIADERLAQLRKKSFRGSASGSLLEVRSALSRYEASLVAKQALDLEIWMWDETKW